MDSNVNINEIFGLTKEQSVLLFSTQKIIALYDYSLPEKSKRSPSKSLWIAEWEKNILLSLKSSYGEECHLYSHKELNEAFKKEMENSVLRTWYYILVLECLEFTPYSILGTENDRKYKKLKYDDKSCDKFIFNFFEKQRYISKEKIERLYKTFEKSVKKQSGNNKGLIILASTATVATITAILAPYIAPTIVGASFEGLHGVALTNACLALLGGGAVAAGGYGMLGGTVVIAGGGAILGMSSSALVMTVVENSPEYTISQNAKLETILKEVILNTQQDIVSAQQVLQKYKQQIEFLSARITQLEMEDTINKAAIQNLKKSLKYSKATYSEMNKFSSAYETGLNAGQNEKR